uniref:Uncharacterized protein n=1 Tax=Leersia perrieri TaxID=77586 RepID=A0A0D9WSC0_9ORYZ
MLATPRPPSMTVPSLPAHACRLLAPTVNDDTHACSTLVTPTPLRASDGHRQLRYPLRIRVCSSTL